MTEKPPSPFSGLDKALLRSTRPQAPVPNQTSAPAEPVVPSTPARSRRSPKSKPIEQNQEASKQDNNESSGIASTIASKISSYDDELIRQIRGTVKTPGREVSFVRLTPAEKARLAEVVYTYKRQGKKTTENEINRIAVNFILEDYDAHGDNSVLAKVIEALLA